MNYLNTDCLENTLTYNSPVAFNALIKNNNCVTLNGTTDYIYLGDDNVLSDVSKVSCRCKLSSSTTAQYIFSNIFSKTTYGNALAVLESTNPKVRLTIENKHYDSVEAYTILTDNNFHTIEVSNVGTLKVDNIIYELTQSDNENICSYTFIGTRSISNSLGEYYSGSICDFKCFNIDDDLIHWYPMAEGSNNIVYDAIGNNNARLTASSISTCWETKQDIFAYNLTEGFRQEPSTLSVFTAAKVPNNKNLVIYKSDLTTNTDGWYKYDALTSAYDSINKCFNITSILSSSTATMANNLLPTYISDYYSPSYKVHIKLKNNGINNIKYINTGLYGYAVTNATAFKSLAVDIAPSEFFDTWIDIPKSSYLSGAPYWTVTYFIGCTFSTNAVETTDNQWALYMCELQQVDNFDDYLKVENGHNLAESKLDWTQGITDIPELNTLSGIDNYTPATDIGGLYKRTITAGEQNYLIYKQVQTDVNLKRINNKLR